ncbi:MAG: hypothetical protein H6729_07315 [Deltaproteobacteria bacterium]|nr:hypothetical protein [Deltaproteobacteria bacterium]
MTRISFPTTALSVLTVSILTTQISGATAFASESRALDGAQSTTFTLSDAPRARLVFAAEGPGDQNLSVGGYLSAWAIFPMADLRLSYGLSDNLSLHARTSIGAMVNIVGVGVRYAFIHADGFSLGAELSGTALFYSFNGESGTEAGLTPKLLMSLGRDESKWTLSVTPWIAQKSTDPNSDGYHFVEINVGFEGAWWDTVTFAAQLGVALIVPGPDSIDSLLPLPQLSVGCNF